MRGATRFNLQMPRTFRLNLLRIQERLPEVTQGMKTTKAQHAEQHALTLPQGPFPSACHTIGGTGAEIELRRGLAHRRWKERYLCVLSTLLYMFMSTSIP